MKIIFTRVIMILYLQFTCSIILTAQALYPVSLIEKVKNATLITEGMVESQESFWNDQHTMIFTANWVKVSKVFAGSLSGDYMEVLTQGGSVGNTSIEASDLLHLEKGTNGIFFCYPNELKIKSPSTGEQLYDVYSSGQGCYTYNTTKMTAAAPFEYYSSIVDGLYPAIKKITGIGYTNKNPSVSFVKPPAASGVSLMGLNDFSPKVLNGGAFEQTDSNLLIITGSGFGAATGTAAILFDNTDNGPGGAQLVVLSTSSLVTLWTDAEIQVKLPTNAGTGYFSIRKADNSFFTSADPLTVNYSVQTATFAGNPAQQIKDAVLQSNLMSTNGLGGYDIVYSTGTAGSGKNFATSLEKITFQRALATWKEVCGSNIREAGNSSNQVVTGADGLNTIMFDNKNTTIPVLASGILAITYSFNTTCTVNGQFNFPSVKTGFDVVIRNSGVSAGSTNFTLGPCPPAVTVSQTDLETVLLHELGHANGLGHIIAPYEGSSLPFVNPGKVMNYAIVNGVKRTSPDRAAKSGVDYNLSNKGLTFGNCSYTVPMTALATTLESKDECPADFPTLLTGNNTLIAFDLVHATSNTDADPQYTAINCNGTGTGVTNTAYTAFKTSNSGDLTISVSGYVTTPVDQQACPNGEAGIELALYEVAGCPVGQNYPEPFACRTFNGNGVLSNITLATNTTYLIMVDGINNTKATFNLLLNGVVLPVKIKVFNGSISGNDNLISWDFDALASIARVTLQKSMNGQSFENLQTWAGTSFSLKGNYPDRQANANTYYRLKFEGTDGRQEYSNIINLIRKVSPSWSIYPNPAKGKINLYPANVFAGKYTTRLFTSNGMLVASQVNEISQASQRIQIESAKLAKGQYKLVVTSGEGKNVFLSNVSIIE